MASELFQYVSDYESLLAEKRDSNPLLDRYTRQVYQIEDLIKLLLPAPTSTVSFINYTVPDPEIVKPPKIKKKKVKKFKPGKI